MGKTSTDLSLPIVGASEETEKRGVLSAAGTDNPIDAIRRAETMVRKFLKDAGVVLTDRKLPDEKPEAPKKTEDGKIPQPKDQSFLAPLITPGRKWQGL